MRIEIKKTGHVRVMNGNHVEAIYSPADDLPEDIQSLVDEHPHKDRRTPEAKQAYLDRIEAQRIADEPTPEQKEAQANAEARRIIQERLIERELETNTDMKALIEEAKTKDNPGQYVRENVGRNGD